MMAIVLVIMDFEAAPTSVDLVAESAGPNP